MLVLSFSRLASTWLSMDSGGCGKITNPNSARTREGVWVGLPPGDSCYIMSGVVPHVIRRRYGGEPSGIGLLI